MRLRLVTTLAVAALGAAAVLATVTADPANGYPSRAEACTTCHPAAPTATTVSATPSTTTPAAGATYTVTISLVGLNSSGDTGYWISNASGTPTASVSGGATGTNQTSYVQTMTAPSAPGTYSYTVWCEWGSTGGGAAKSTTYSITVPGTTSTVTLTSLAPNHAQTGATVVIAGAGLGTDGAVRFGATVATTSAWSATSITATVPDGLAAGAADVTVTPTGGAASNALAFTVDAPSSGGDTTPPTTVASGAGDDGWCHGVVKIHLTATDNSGGVGVASITYSIDGGAPITVNGSSATVTISAGSGDDDDDVGARATGGGVHTITFYATDAAGNVETLQTLSLNVDSSRPSTRAPHAERVRRHHKATLRYEVRDATPNGGTAKVVITIRNGRGHVVKKLNLGDKPVNTRLEAAFRCSLHPGAYRFSVRATDRAGNTQAHVATQTLTVLGRSSRSH